MEAFSFNGAIDIPRPVEIVWPYLVDWERLDRWMREADRFRVLGSRREGLGVEAEARVRILGIATRDRIRVTGWEPPSLLELAHLGWVKGTGTMELSPTVDGCNLVWREELLPPWGVMGRLGMWILGPWMRRTFRQDLGRLRTLIVRET